jgi:hypothetical protein
MGRDSSAAIPTRYELDSLGDRIPVLGETFRTRPDRPWGPPSLLYNVYRVFTGGKAAGAWRFNYPPHLAPRLKWGNIMLKLSLY